MNMGIRLQMQVQMTGRWAYSEMTKLREQYKAIKSALEKISYDQHKWLICVDLKMINFLIGQQSRITKYPCFLCLRDSRDRAQHNVKTDWPVREELVLMINMLMAYKNLGWNMSIKMHSHIDQFPENLGALIDEQGNVFTRTCEKWKHATRAGGTRWWWRTTAGL